MQRIVAPLVSQEVWAAGVTYYRSRTARMAESQDAGGDSFYDRVYNAGETKTGPGLPDEKERAEAVNRVVGMALDDMLNDSKLVGLLVQ